MKKEYNNPTIEVIAILSENLLTASGKFTGGETGILEGQADHNWFD